MILSVCDSSNVLESMKIVKTVISIISKVDEIYNKMC